MTEGVVRAQGAQLSGRVGDIGCQLRRERGSACRGGAGETQGRSEVRDPRGTEGVGAGRTSEVTLSVLSGVMTSPDSRSRAMTKSTRKQV